MFSAIAQVLVALVNTLTTMVTGEEAGLANADNQRTTKVLGTFDFIQGRDSVKMLLAVFGAIVIIIVFAKSKNK